MGDSSNYDDKDFEEVLDESSSESGGYNTVETSNLNANVPKKSIKEKAISAENAAGSAVKGAGVAAEATGKGMKVAGKGMQAAGKGLDKAGDSLMQAGKALSSSGLGAIAGVPLAALGAVGKGAGKGAQAAGKGTEKAGQSVEKVGKNTKETGKKIKKNASENAEKIKNAKGKNRLPSPLKRPSDSNSDENDGNSIVDKTKDKIKDGVKKVKEKTKKNTTPLKSESSGETLEVKLKKLKIKLGLILGTILIVIMLLAVIVSQIFGPIYDVLQAIDEKWDSISLRLNKANNIYAGFGNKTTKQAFYDEVEYLYEKYDEQLDIPLVLATLFYTEKDSYDEKFGELPTVGDGESDVEATKSVILSTLKSKYEQMYETAGEDSFNYTVGKIYRLRKLARNQMESTLFNPGYFPTNAETISITQFFDEVKEDLSIDLSRVIESIPSLFANPVDLFNVQKGFYNLLQLITGEENIDTLNWTGEEFAHRCLEILNSLIVDAYAISSIDFSLSGITVTVYRYEANDDNYKNYLHDYYIPNMPEFKKFLNNLDGDKKDAEINRIIKGIYDYAEQFDEIYGYKRDASGEDESLECQGTIDMDIVDHLAIPVDKTSFDFSGKEGYGVVGGSQNNGVDITADSAGIAEGDNVKAIYGGEVIEVGKNNCSISTNTSCNPLGNYVKIKHNVSGTDQKPEITSIYTHLKDIKVKKKDQVKKGDIIGHIGITGDVTEPTLHFEMMTSSGSYIDPTNLFIKCVRSEDGELVGGTLEEQVWCFFINKGYSKVSAAAAMGNINHESSFKTNNLEDGSNAKTGISDDEFTNRVDSKKISRNEFLSSSTYGIYTGGRYGYGLAQWTDPGRKAELYDLTVKKGKSISDVKGQMTHLSNEISNWVKNGSENAKAWSKATSQSEISSASEGYRNGFEVGTAPKPRIDYAKSAYEKYKNLKCSSSTKMNNLNASGGSGSNPKISSYLQWMTNIANDDSHGYSQSSRNGPNYDCSSFVYYALVETGVIKKESYAFTTDNMGSILEKNGFKKIVYQKDKVKAGDILVRSSHTTTILSEGKEVAAHTSRLEKSKQISITDFSGSNYDYIYRLK